MSLNSITPFSGSPGTLQVHFKSKVFPDREETISALQAKCAALEATVQEQEKRIQLYEESVDALAVKKAHEIVQGMFEQKNAEIARLTVTLNECGWDKLDMLTIAAERERPV